MKKELFVLSAVLAAVFFLPLLLREWGDAAWQQLQSAVPALCEPRTEIAEEGSGSTQTQPETPTASTPSSTTSMQDPIATSPSPTPDKPAPPTVSLLTETGAVTMDMEEYLRGVVAAEMPADFESEALKAQAVAARTYAMYRMAEHRHENGQICTDYACCQAWSPESGQRELWGDNYEKNSKKIAFAVTATEGEYLAFEGKPVFAAFHSSSPGATEDCGSVWNPLPYLVSVDSPETADNVPEYISSVSCTALDFRDTVLYAFPAADFSGEESAWIGEIEKDPSGRVSTIALGGVRIMGTTLRSLFKLRSTAFELDYADGLFTFTVTGYGHGVGMSQYGANIMAGEGADYIEILAHYYRGAILVNRNPSGLI